MLCVSNFQPTKNQVSLIDAFTKANLRDASLVLIGSALTRYGTKVTTQASRARGQVLVLQNVERGQIAAAYQAADLFATASLTEAQPLVLLDSMGAGLPFVTLRAGAVDELPGGITVDSIPELSRAIRDLSEQPQRLKALGEAGKAAVRNRFNWERSAAAYDDLFQRLRYQPRPIGRGSGLWPAPQ